MFTWLTALRYQMRQPKPWEIYNLERKENSQFRNKFYIIPEEVIPLEEAIDPYLSAAEKAEIFAKGNRGS
jgi:putative membrane protein